MAAAPHTQTPTSTASSPELAHVLGHWDSIRPNSPIYDLFFSNITFKSAVHGRIISRLPLESIHINSKSILHGAVSAALIDWAGGMAIASTGKDKTGVSTDIHVSYVSAAKAGDELEVEAWVSRAGGTLAFTQVEIRRVGREGKEGGVVATGSHTKYLRV